MQRRVLSLLALLCCSAAAQPALELRSGTAMTRTFGPTSEQDATIRLRRGESAEVIVVQHDIDVVVTLRAPGGTLLDEIDSPNGRNGPEPVSIYAPKGGTYRIHVRPFSNAEPEGRIEVRVVALRSAVETAAVRRQRSEVRAAAAEWLRRSDSPLPVFDDIATAQAIPAFDELARSARIIGLGEATHGSRELNDVRLALVKRLVERFGFRVVALEDSTARWRALEPYVAGAASSPATAVEWFWIGRRSRKALLEWARSWNLRHPTDQVRIVGTDPQNNPFWRREIGRLLERAYGEPFAKAWAEPEKELIAADDQTMVFGDSSVSQPTRDLLQGLLARVTLDAPLLKRDLGEADYNRLLDDVQQLAAFADFNGGSSNPLAKSRDWYMALATLRAIDLTQAKAIYWGHNSHVSAVARSWGPTGGLLRKALGCGYRAVSTTFGRGAFLAQVPNDAADRLHVNAVGAAVDDSVESALSEVRDGTHIASWSCGPKADLPAWFATARMMHWVGALYAPESARSASYRPYRLTDEFDAVIYVPVVHAEDDPGDQPTVPARKR